MYFIDLLNKTCKITAVNATTSLAKLLQLPLSIDKCIVKMNQLDEIIIGKDLNEKIISFYVPILGNIVGASLFYYNYHTAFKLCDLLHKLPFGTTKILSEKEIATLSEVTNIFMGNFLSHFSQLLKLDLLMHHLSIFDSAKLSQLYFQMETIFQKKMSKSNIQFHINFKHNDIKFSFFLIFNTSDIHYAVENATNTEQSDNINMHNI